MRLSDPLLLLESRFNEQGSLIAWLVPSRLEYRSAKRAEWSLAKSRIASRYDTLVNIYMVSTDRVIVKPARAATRRIAGSAAE